MKLEYKATNSIRGSLIYALGDSIAALLSHNFCWQRALGILLVGATVYAFEIPNYFNWIAKKVAHPQNNKQKLLRASLAMLYFNPLWIARHILFIQLFTRQFNQINISILTVGTFSFLANIPVSLGANYLIQNKIPLKNRFIASAIFSGVMAIYYSLSAVWFY